MVRLLSILSGKILRGCGGVLSSEDVSAGLASLRYMSCDVPEVRQLVAALAARSPLDSEPDPDPDPDSEMVLGGSLQPTRRLYLALMEKRRKSAPS